MSAGPGTPGPDNRQSVGGCAAFALAALGFALVAVLVSAGLTERFDRAVVSALRTPGALHDPLGPGWAGAFFGDITEIGSRAVIGFAGCLVAGYLALLRRWAALAFLTLSLVGGAGVSGFFKGLFARVRPDIVPHLVDERSLSFPSSHATYAAVACVTFAILLLRVVHRPAARVYIVGAAAVVAMVVGFSRVYLGVHYPSDVVAGWFLGSAWALGCWLAVDRLSRR